MDTSPNTPFYLAILVVLSNSASVIAWIILILGVIWSPFSAVACSMAAHKNIREGIAYEWIGLVSSLVFLMPGICLLARLRSGSYSPKLVAVAYITVLFVWLFAPTSNWIHMTITDLGNPETRVYLATLDDWNQRVFLYLAPLLISMIMWMVCLLSGIRILAHRRSQSEVSIRNVVHSRSFLMPFYLAPVSILIMSLAFLQMWGLQPV